MTTATKEPKTFGHALWMGSDPDRGWVFVTRGVGVRFSFEDVKTYCREHADYWSADKSKPWVIYVDHMIFSEPDVKRGDWLLWLPDKGELQHQRITVL